MQEFEGSRASDKAAKLAAQQNRIASRVQPSRSAKNSQYYEYYEECMETEPYDVSAASRNSIIPASVVTSAKTMARGMFGGGGRPLPPRAICQLCGRSFANEHDLQLHELTVHHEEKEAATLEKQQNETQMPPVFGEFSFALPQVDKTKCFLPHRLGANRGIQGENNSCYLDAGLTAMFYLNRTYDTVLVNALEDPKLEYMRSFLAFNIVGNLRRRGYVPSGLVVEWRRMINGVFNGEIDFDGFCREQEASDLVVFVLEKLCRSPNCRFELEEVKMKLPPGHTLQETEGEWLDVEVPLGESPSARIKDPPTRDQVHFQLLPPSNPRQHGIWCIQDLLDDSLKRYGQRFSKAGTSLILQLPRYGKGERLVDTILPSTTVVLQPQKLHYALKSIIVIGKSHFVTYMRAIVDGEPRWLYFDSMSDRIGDSNVPEMQDVTECLRILDINNVESLLERTKPNVHLLRILSDMSLAFYALKSRRAVA